MYEIRFGSLDARHLHLRFFMPMAFRRYADGCFRFSPLRLLNPLLWLREASYHSSWRFWCKRWAETNHRCYCPTGVMYDGTLVVCGFGFWWFYSWFDGEIPCWCDKALAELEADDDVCAEATP